MRTPVHDSNLVYSFKNKEDEPMAAQCFEKVFASWIYFLMGISTAHIFLVGLANGIAIGYHYPLRQELLIGAALTGAATLLLAAILVHFRPAKAYVMAMAALPLLLLAFWPLVEIVIHQGFQFTSFTLSDLFAMVLFPLIAVFTPLRLVKLLRS